jgi:hypothetical protein
LPAEGDQRRSPRLGCRHSPPNVALGRLLEVKTHLFVEVGIVRCAIVKAGDEAERGANARNEAPRHDALPADVP